MEKFNIFSFARSRHKWLKASGGGPEKKRVHNFISLDLIVKGTPEIQRNVQAHCDTLESTKKKKKTASSSSFLCCCFFFFQSSVTLCQLAVTLANTHSYPRPAELGSASRGVVGGGTNTKLNSHSRTQIAPSQD